MIFHPALLAPLVLVLAACNGSAEPSSSETETIASPTADPQLDRREMGPLNFAFDPGMLRAFDVEITFPPDYEATYGGIKLLPIERAELIGQDECTYGQSGLTQICDAAMEAGMAFAILPRPAEYYRDRLIESGIPAEEIENATVAGIEGFRFTAQAEGSGAANTFLPAGEQTVLVERAFRGGEGRGGEAFGRVLSSVTIAAAAADPATPE